MSHQSGNPLAPEQRASQLEGRRIGLRFSPGEFGSSKAPPRSPPPSSNRLTRRWFEIEIVFPGLRLRASGNLPYNGYRRSRLLEPDQYHYITQTLKYALPCVSKYTSAPPCVPTHHRFLHPDDPSWTVYALYSKPRSSPRRTRNVPGWSLHVTIGASLAHLILSSNRSSQSLPSRLKKIKCVQIKSQPRCEACEAGNTPCQFRDRERYFAERSRIVTGASAGSSPAHSRRSSSSQSTEPSAIPPPTRSDSVDASGWYSGAQTSSDHGHPSRYASSSPSYSLSSSPQSNPEQWFSSPLVEPARLHYERSAYSTPDSYNLRCLTLSITSRLGNIHSLRPYLNLAMAPPAAIILITPSKIHQVHSVTAPPPVRHLHYLILVMARCLTQRCSCT